MRRTGGVPQITSGRHLMPSECLISFRASRVTMCATNVDCLRFRGCRLSTVYGLLRTHTTRTPRARRMLHAVRECTRCTQQLRRRRAHIARSGSLSMPLEFELTAR